MALQVGLKSEQLVASLGTVSKQAVQGSKFLLLFPMHTKNSKASSRQGMSSGFSDDPPPDHILEDVDNELGTLAIGIFCLGRGS
jgi:hypothetical protein